MSHSFCETVTAPPLAPWHIRVLDGDKLRPNGGIRGQALCGRSLDGGWDIPSVEVDPTSPRLRSIACPRCVQALTKEVERA